MKPISLLLFDKEQLIPMGKETTIYDIAKELKISPTTVSRALNNHSTVNEKTKQRIFDLANQMGYRFNMFASNLRKQKTNTIGVIVPHLNSYFQASVIAGIEKVANIAGYNLLISQSMLSLQKEIENSKTMFNGRVDGLLVSLAHNTESTDHFEPFFKRGIPVIFFDRVAEHKQCIGVKIDNIQAAYKATCHLIEQGCKHLLHIGGNLNVNVYADRLKGFKYALMDNNIPFNDESVISNNLTEASGVEAAHEILKRKDLPDGIFVANDACAVMCMKTLKNEGVSIPKDIAFVGFNNDPMSRVIDPGLTTIDYPGFEMGEIAVRNLINLLDGVTEIISTNTITLRSELIIRESSIKNTVQVTA